MEFTLINHLDSSARPLKCLNDQGGNVNITVGRDIYNSDTIFPIAFNSRPFISVNNIATELDHDNWIASAVKIVTNSKFTYMTAQNNVTNISWLAVGN